MYRHRIKIIILLIVFVVFLIWLTSPQLYIYRHTGFRTLIAFTEYYYDLIGEGKDYDSLHVFKISQLDSKRLSDKVQQDSRWKPLPLSTCILEGKNSIVSPNYNEKLAKYSSLQEGYYLFSDGYELCIFDCKNNILIIRARSIQSNY